MRCCFNSQPPEGGWAPTIVVELSNECFNSQPPEGGWALSANRPPVTCGFQLTAARRRLVPKNGRA